MPLRTARVLRTSSRSWRFSNRCFISWPALPLCRTRRHFFPLTRSFVTAPPTEGDSKKDDEKWTNADYINSNASQTVILAFGSAILGLLNPHRADLIAILGETTGSVALNRIKSSMERTLEGRLILEQKPRVNSKTVPLEALLEQDPNTFGYSADDRPVVKHIRDIELSYIMQRYREVHDFWHVLTGAPTTVEGEIGQKAFEFLQTGLPMAALSTAVGPLRLTNNQRKRILTGYLPWAYACNQRCNFLMGVRFEDYFQEDLKDFRDMLGVVPVSEYVTEIDEETS